MQYTKSIILLLFLLSACSPKGDSYLSSRQIFQLMSDGSAWCEDRDDQRTCNSVSRLASITDGQVSRVWYLYAGVAKIVYEVTETFEDGGLCTSVSEAQVRAFRIFRSSDPIAMVTDTDQQVLGTERDKLLNALVDQLRPTFGRKTCTKYKIESTSADKKITTLSVHEFVDGIIQPSAKKTLISFFTQDSDGIQLRKYKSSAPR